MSSSSGLGRIDWTVGGSRDLVCIPRVIRQRTWMSVAAQAWLKGFTQLQISAVTVAAGAFWLLLFMPAAAISGAVTLRVDFGTESLGLLAFAGILPIALGDFCWHYGVSRIGVMVASMYNNLLPIAAVAVTLWLGGSFTWQQLLGAAVILVGVLSAQFLALRRVRYSGSDP